ncbi:hypothetical protein [Burkholderia contaminans]|uniref:hypothetical protein n=1 Tax=Burkholderia contaminans TaxID=488447 RepID=UPI00163A31E1|nr:hypothetical protein [Burkholderia contaminans]
MTLTRFVGKRIVACRMPAIGINPFERDCPVLFGIALAERDVIDAVSIGMLSSPLPFTLDPAER